MSILGTSVLRSEDPRFLTSGGVYVDDLREPELLGAAHATFVRSTQPHARITGIDTSAAAELDGVVAVFTAADVDMPDKVPQFLGVEPGFVRPWLARDTVRFVGEAVAMVVTTDRYTGPDAAELVEVDYDPLPPLVDPRAARREEVVLFPAVGTNVCASFQDGPADEQFFDGCEVVVSEDIVNQRVAPAPMEVRGAAAVWSGERLTCWVSTQSAHGSREALVAALGVPEGDVRVVAPDVGGGFGAKGGSYPEEVLVAWAARRLGRPVRWVETRSESMLALAHGRAQIQRASIGGDRSGRIRAYRLEVLQDAGGYPDIGAFLPFLTRMMAPGVYDIERLDSRAESVVTTTVPVGAYRGAGRPEASAAIERMVDRFAAEVGLDPAQVRRQNFIAAASFPYRTPGGVTYDSGDYERALDLVLQASGYAELRAEQRRRREAGEPMLLGIGLAAYVEITAGDSFAGEHARVQVEPDGSVTVLTGSSPHGQGHATAWAMIVAERMGVPMESVTVRHGDTALVPQGVGTFGSRSLQLGGSAVHSAATDVVEQARQLAADLLEAAVDDVVVGDGRVHVAGDRDSGFSWAELASRGRERGAELAADSHFVPEQATFPFGAHVAVVEVDSDTGAVRLVAHTAVDDAGRILNPLLFDGQRHGGIAQGVAQALVEEMRYGEDGNPMTANFADYGFITADLLPSFTLARQETPTPLNPLGAKGIGEAGTIGSTPAVQNAVVDALAHLGVRHLDMPLTSERVWRAIRAAEGGR